MKLFFAVIVVAAVIGGFVGAELMDSSFSITGVVIGGVGTCAVLLALGAFFDAQERKKEEKLPPEMRAVFDRMFGQSPSSGAKKPAPLQKHRSKTGNTANPDNPLGNTIRNLARQHAEAAARGERITNRMPKPIRTSMLKLDVVRALQTMDSEAIGIDGAVYQQLLNIDSKGGVGIAAKEFDGISQDLPLALLEIIETDIRAMDAGKPKPKFDDIDQLYRI